MAKFKLYKVLDPEASPSPSNHFLIGSYLTLQSASADADRYVAPCTVDWSHPGDDSSWQDAEGECTGHATDGTVLFMEREDK